MYRMFSKGSRMKHHEYQIYYGGIKQKIEGLYWCKDCLEIVDIQHYRTTKIQKNHVRSHKK